MFNDNSTLLPHQGVGQTKLEHGRSGDSSSSFDGGDGGAAPPMQSSFAPPAPGSRVDLIFAGLAVDAGVGLDETSADETTVDAGARDPIVDVAPVDEAPVDEAPIDVNEVEVEVEELLPDPVFADQVAPVHDLIVDEPIVDETELWGIAAPAHRADGDAAQVDDDFWSGAASDGSVPTRKVVCGARSADSESLPPGWVKWAARRRRR